VELSGHHQFLDRALAGIGSQRLVAFIPLKAQLPKRRLCCIPLTYQLLFAGSKALTLASTFSLT